jgi:hypothetical protein
MDRRRAEENLELIRTLMERATRYEYLSARAGLQVGALALAGSFSFLWLDPARPAAFGLIWGAVFGASLAVTIREQIREVQAAGAPLWTRPAREIVRALLPALAVALVLTIHAFTRGRHLELPGIWMLCYGCGALSTLTYAPPALGAMGVGFIGCGTLTVFLGPAWSTLMMGIAFGGGHLVLGARLLAQRRQTLRLVEPPVMKGTAV